MLPQSHFISFRSRDFGDGLKRFKPYNLPAAIVTELFKPSTDSASLLVSIKNKYLIWVWGFLFVTSQRRHVFEFLTHFDWGWALIQCAIFMAQTFLETRRPSASLEPLIDLLACLEPKLWPKNPVVHKTAEKAWVSLWRLAWLVTPRH